jgi:glycosyltransferase involved in cell wall biosynthesis
VVVIKEPLISVIVPIYNVEKYLNKCISSIVGQSYKNLEIILVDDGSPDYCPKICDEWANLDKRIFVIHQNNGGRGAARNAGIAVATGEYIGFVDGDDYIDANFYETLINLATEYEADVVCEGFNYLDSSGKIIKETKIPSSEIRVMNSNEVLHELFDSCNGFWISLCNKIINRDSFKNLKFPEGRLFEDWTIAPFIYYYSNSFITIPVASYNYIIHTKSAVRTESVNRYYDCVLADYDHFLFFNDKGVSEFNEKIFNYIKSDYLKALKTYLLSNLGTKELSKEHLKKAYRIAFSVTHNKSIWITYHFRFLVRLYLLFKKKG